MKKRLIFVPQLPVHMRYSEWWQNIFEKEFEKYFEVITLGKDLINESIHSSSDSFAPTDKAIEFEQHQIKQFLNLDLRNDDVLFLSDISFPGFFSNVLHHKKIKNAYAFCHGTSRNNFDYFKSVQDSKWLVETGHSKLFKKVFVATEYHKNKLGWDNVEVIGVPKPPFEIFKSDKKEYNIISVCRDSIQKRTKSIEKEVEGEFGKLIYKNDFNTWSDYYKFLSKSKILLITSKEDTFNYSVLEAVKNGCIPICPNKLAFPELLPREYLYDNEKELFYKIYYLSNYKECLLSLLNQSLVDNFYENLIGYINC